MRHRSLGVLMTVLAVTPRGIACIRPPRRPGESTKTQVFPAAALAPVPDAALWS